jgi:hypothetical protein
MTVIPMVQCRKCRALTRKHKCLLRSDLRTSLSPGRKRRCSLVDIARLAENFLYQNQSKTASFSLRHLTGSSLKIESRSLRSSFFSRILNFFKNLFRGKKQ